MNLVIWGAGGHGKVVFDVATSAGHQVVAWLDDSRAGQSHLGVSIHATEYRHTLRQQYPDIAAVVAVGSNTQRARLYSILHSEQWPLPALVHSTAIVHSSVRPGFGTVIMPGAIINIDTRLGANCIVNTGATMDHDCDIADHVHVAPGVHLAGSVRLDVGVFMGIGSVALPGRHVGAWSTVGAGAVVVRDVGPGVTAVGVPARAGRQEAGTKPGVDQEGS